MAESLQDSDFTSVQARLFEISRDTSNASKSPAHATAPPLLPFMGAERADARPQLPWNLQDYLELVDTAGRLAHPQKRGAIPATQIPVLEVLGIAPDEWFATVTQMQQRFELVVGSPPRRELFAAKQGRRWHRGKLAAQRLYRRAQS